MSDTIGRGSGRRSVSLLLALVAVVVVMGAVTWLQNRSRSLPTMANLVVLSGEATVTRADAGSDPPLAAGERTVLQRGDEVRVGPESRAELAFNDQGTVELDADTHIGILDLHQSPMSRDLVVILALHQGKTLTRIRSMLFQGARFEIETKVATVRARGTVFGCDIVEENHVYVAAYEGVVQVSMGEQEVELQAGQGVDVRLGQPLVPCNHGLVPSAASGVVPTDAQVSPQPTRAPASPTDSSSPFSPAIVTPTRPGDDIVLYTVQQGDTLYSIARHFGVSWQSLWAANKNVLSSPEVIRAGQKLRIPKQ